jgi:hypothetical protein
MNAMSWHKLETGAPELAAFGAERFVSTRVAYLATVRGVSAPRVYPVMPINVEARLYVGSRRKRHVLHRRSATFSSS